MYNKHILKSQPEKHSVSATIGALQVSTLLLQLPQMCQNNEREKKEEDSDGGKAPRKHFPGAVPQPLKVQRGAHIITDLEQ